MAKFRRFNRVLGCKNINCVQYINAVKKGRTLTRIFSEWKIIL